MLAKKIGYLQAAVLHRDAGGATLVVCAHEEAYIVESPESVIRSLMSPGPVRSSSHCAARQKQLTGLVPRRARSPAGSAIARRANLSCVSMRKEDVRLDQTRARSISADYERARLQPLARPESD